jgi:hypothetical protein
VDQRAGLTWMDADLGRQLGVPAERPQGDLGKF